ncbi:MAG: hypothetical protein U1D25_05585 [Hydrogenophaga sp.]|nr:hypothetical protein [Hydrogenophaga sp.]
MNNILCTRIFLVATEMALGLDILDDWQIVGLKNWYLRDKEGSRGLHIEFKNISDF